MNAGIQRYSCTLDINSNVNSYYQFQMLHIFLKDLTTVHLMMMSSVVKLCFEDTASFKMNFLQRVTSRLGILG